MKRSTIYIILFHVIYWGIVLYFLYARYNPQGNADYQRYYASYFLQVVLGFIAFYVVYGFIFPYFIQKNKRATDATSLVLLFIILAFMVGLPLLEVYSEQYQHGKYRVNLGQILFGIFSFGLSSLLFKGFIVWLLDIGYKEQLEKSNLESNLALLKARINPHFLFNTLNNIDVLIEKDPATASTYLKKLSDILRFTLYESPSATIPLSKEADYIKQYIELQQIRTNNADFVKFSFEPGATDLQIAPMLFIPFIENAFKYCTNKKIKDAVVISLGTSANKVIFSCSNAYDAEVMITHEESGLGLDLIKSRLELLFPKNYTLDIDKTTDRFNVNLSITLHDDKLPDN
ncbi:MAG: histidine kinase [Bacteroidota bacterium]